MSRLFQADDRFRDAVSEADAQIFITGGHGGLVTYDGRGGPMRKRGGPMDRLFLLMNDGQLLGDAGLDVEYGHIEFCTGSLTGTVDVIESEAEDTCIRYDFQENDDDNGFEVIGGVNLLGISRDSVLVSGPVRPSVMICQTGDKSGNDPTLPFAAWHDRVYVNDRILEWFGFSDATAIAAETGWCKIAPAAVASMEVHTSWGAGFSTQQHLGHLRVFLRV